MQLLPGTVIAGYLLSTIFVRNILIGKLVKDRQKIFFYLIILLSFFLFAFYTYSLINQTKGFDFNTSLSLTLLIINFLFCLFMFTKPIYHLGLILFPITALIILITLFYKTGNAPVTLTNNNLQLHILSSFISYGFLGLAGIEAILLLFQEKKLRHVKNSSLEISLPPIEVMEKIMFDLIVIGFILLTISVLSGIPFILSENNFLLMQKIIFSVVAWITFAYLLFKRFSTGIRGEKAVHLTLSGIIFLFIAYLGTKLFFELL